MPSPSQTALLILGSDGSCELFQPTAPTGTIKIPLGQVASQCPASDLLPHLLSEGWMPIRETGFGDGKILVILSKGGF